MKNVIGITSGFFIDQKKADWASVVDAGFTGAELCFNGFVSFDEMINNATSVHQRMLAGGMIPTSAHLPFGSNWDISMMDADKRDVAMNNMKKVLDQVAAWEIPICVLHASFEPIDNDERKHRLEIAVHSIRELSEYAKTKSIRIAVENLPRTCLGNSSEEIDYLTQKGTIAGLCFDVNHLLKESHEEFISKVGRYAVTTHLSDYDKVDEHHWFIGDGVIEWDKVIGLLLETGYKGQFLFELKEDSARDGSLVTPQRLMDTFKAIVG